MGQASSWVHGLQKKSHRSGLQGQWFTLGACGSHGAVQWGDGQRGSTNVLLSNIIFGRFDYFFLLFAAGDWVYVFKKYAICYFHEHVSF